ncbi:hypothetical protein I6E29_00805 [Arcanobacterium haemolyticum]|nr:hypothetical protein [Arcanobacterium haemolyticum]
MAEKTDYISASNNADNVKLIKQYALFLFKEGELTAEPTSADWTPPTGVKPIGYSTEDGAVLHPEAGEETELKGHNGDVTISESSGGYWTLQLAGIECKKSIAEAYFGVEAGTNGDIHVDDASNPFRGSLVLAALDQKGRPMVLHAPKVAVGERDDLTLSYTEQLSMSVTFRMQKPAGGHMFSLYGFIENETAGAARSAVSTTGK